MHRFAILAVILGLAGCQPEFEDSTETPSAVSSVQPDRPPHDPESMLQVATKQRIADLTSIAHALEDYKAARGTYPDSGGKWASYKMSWGLSKGEKWIPELEPDFLPTVPRDPQNSEDTDGPQYLYYSDGMVYKLIAHNAPDCDDAIKSARVKKDPVRVREDGSCWAFGIWTPGGESF